jgi:hypothetical protein
VRRILVVVGSLVVVAAVAFGVLRFTATDETTGARTGGGDSFGDAAGADDSDGSDEDGDDPTTTTAGGQVIVEDPDDTTPTSLAPRDGSRDTELAGLLLAPTDFGAGFAPLGPDPEEARTRCGTVGLDDPADSQGRALAGAENVTGTLSVIQSIRVYPDAQAGADAYNGAVAAINCPLVELTDGDHPTATGSEVGGLGADQSYAIDYFADTSATAPTPIGGGFVARVGTRVLTLRYLVDPTDQAAVGYDLAAVVRAAIAKLAAAG